MHDYDYMKLALSMARAATGQTSPNPSVGAVVVKNGEILGMGAHLKAGTPHAEVHAIRTAGENARGADLYVTLEPCSHYGKTPPCTELIISSGIKRVVVATLDPNPLVAGTGVKQLRQAGIEVEVGIGKEEANQINEPFFHYIQTGKPYITLKAAVTLDGKTATKTGDSKWITSTEARSDVHQLRHEHDAILVGIQTVLKDNPLLTTRLPRGGKNPIRIILDTHLRIPLDANVIKDKTAKTMIITGNEPDMQKVDQLELLGIEVIPLSTGRIEINELLTVLGNRKIMSVLVEGGSKVHASFIEANAFQQLIFYMAPKVIGGIDAIPAIGGEGLDFVRDAAKLEFTSIERLGPDLKITAKPVRKDGDHECLQE
jgi:diaminohydroxyphosphoribosylaminopyrimidine deaminase / 5-amino-6-(5-phosphoribosylamino)uracil reductase